MAINGGNYAGSLIRRLGINSLPIKPMEIAQRLNIIIKEVDAGDDFDGCLVNYDGEKGILLNNRINYEPRKNFTIAHELGHSEILGHDNSEKKCLESDMSMTFGLREPEKEANEFAAELLMPEFFMSESVSYREICMRGIKKISEQCETSLTSSALQYIKYCPEIAAIVVSQKGIIKYFSRTEEMVKRKLFFNTGTQLSKLSVAHDFFSIDKEIGVSERQEEVDIRAWFSEAGYRDYKCIEDAIAIPSQNQVISLLYLEEQDRQEEEDEQED